MVKATSTKSAENIDNVFRNHINNIAALQQEISNIRAAMEKGIVGRFGSKFRTQLKAYGNCDPETLIRYFARQQGVYPVIVEDRTTWFGHCSTLKLPNTPRTNKAVAGLLVIATAVAGKYLRAGDGVFNHENAGKYQFSFVGAGAMKVLDGFIKQCSEDPVFRVALSLPVK